MSLNFLYTSICFEFCPCPLGTSSVPASVCPRATRAPLSSEKSSPSSEQKQNSVLWGFFFWSRRMGSWIWNWWIWWGMVGGGTAGLDWAAFLFLVRSAGSSGGTPLITLLIGFLLVPSIFSKQKAGGSRCYLLFHNKCCSCGDQWSRNWGCFFLCSLKNAVRLGKSS